MKKFFLAVLTVLAMCAVAFAQGQVERDFSNGSPIDGFAVRSITKYTNAAGSTKITIPLASTGASTVTKWCFQPTAASGLRLGTAAGFSGDQKPVAANAEICRTVRKGITQLQYSSTTSGTAVLERQY
jgi:hypothetical protein